MALHKNLVGAHMRDGEVGDKDATAPVDHPAEYLLHARPAFGQTYPTAVWPL